MGEELERVKLLLGEQAVEKLHNSTVLVAGVGGVGSYAAEALARTGIGHLILVDSDEVEISNLNRQIMADHTTLHTPKVRAMHERIRGFAPECDVREMQMFLKEENMKLVCDADFVVDAIDTVTSKLDLIEACHEYGIPFVSSLGMGNRLDSSMVTYTDLWKTQMDPLAKSVRQMARKRGIRYPVPVLFSHEQPRTQNTVVNPDGETRKDRIPPASVIFVPAAAGLLAASIAVRTILEEKI